MSALGKRVKDAREAAQLTMRGIPGVDVGAMSRIESGKASDPNISTLVKISKATGKSLDELATGTASAGRMLELRELQPDPTNPRTITDSEQDQALVRSIKEQGLIQPLAVMRYTYPDSGNQTWLIVAGHRRYAALAHLHGPKSKTLVPVRLVDPKHDADRLLLQLAENMQRADMNPMDQAQAIANLVVSGIDTEAIAGATGRKRRWVQEQASVGRYLDESVKPFLREGVLSISQAVAIAAEKDAKAQKQLAKRAVADRLNEDDIRAIIADTRAKAEQAKKDEQKQLDIEDGADIKRRPIAKSKWTHRRGFLEIEVFQFSAHKFCGTYSWRWRNSGGGGPIPDDHDKGEKTAAIAFLQACRSPWNKIANSARENAEDIAAAIEAHEWVHDQLVKLDATERVLADWKKNHAPPEKPKAKAAAPKAPEAKQPKEEPKPLTIEDLAAPTWAKPMEGDYFVVMAVGAILCKGWAALAGVMFTHYADEEPETLRDLLDRKNWQDDPGGLPYDFGGIVYRITDASHA